MAVRWLMRDGARASQTTLMDTRTVFKWKLTTGLGMMKAVENAFLFSAKRNLKVFFFTDRSLFTAWGAGGFWLCQDIIYPNPPPPPPRLSNILLIPPIIPPTQLIGNRFFYTTPFIHWRRRLFPPPLSPENRAVLLSNPPPPKILNECSLLVW